LWTEEESSRNSNTITPVLNKQLFGIPELKPRIAIIKTEKQ